MFNAAKDVFQSKLQLYMFEYEFKILFKISQEAYFGIFKFFKYPSYEYEKDNIYVDFYLTIYVHSYKSL